MAEEMEVPVLCYWNGRIQYGSNGVYYDRSTPKLIKVKRKTDLVILLDQLYLLTGLDVNDRRSKVKIFGRYPSVVQESMIQFLLLPVVNNTSLETMLEVPSKHPSIENVELYLEMMSDGVVDSTACSPLLANPGSSLKRQRISTPVNVEKGNNNRFIEDEDEEDVDIGNGRDGDMIYKNPGSDVMHQVVNLIGDSSISREDKNRDFNSGDSKPCLSRLWLEDNDLRVGLCFNDRDELKKVVDWCSIKGQRKCVVRETNKDKCMFECIRWKCKWSLRAVRMEKHGLFEIIKYTGPHTCLPFDIENSDSEFEADEIEHVIRVHPTRSFAELKKWWKEKFGYELETKKVRAAKEEAIKRVFGDWDQSFEDLPKLMSALGSSNGLLVDWKYDLFPNPKFASFGAVFWAFPQSIEGFQHCRPLIIVETKYIKYKHPLILMIASAIDAENKNFHLAFAVTKKVSTDTWRWFLTQIREKVTKRKGICLVSSVHSDILAVINEPGSLWQEPWAYHRYCLKEVSIVSKCLFQGTYNDKLISLVEKAGSTSCKKEFEDHLETIRKENSKAGKWLDRNHQKWALVHDNGRRYGIMEKDTGGLFGFKLSEYTVTGVVLLLFDRLRDHFDEMSYRSRGSLNHGDVYTKPVMDKLDEFKKSSVTYDVMPLEDNVFQVKLENAEWTVQLSDSTCTCGKFQSCKIPCLHALAVCKKLKINPLQYVDDCYTVERLYKTYAATFSQVPELSAWPEASRVPRLLPPVIPPPTPLPLPVPTPPSIVSPPSEVSSTKDKTTHFGNKKKS